MKRLTGTKVRSGVYTFGLGRFTVRRRRTSIPVSGGEIRLSWEVLDARGGGKAVASKQAGVSWIINRLTLEAAGDADFEKTGKTLRALNDRLSRRIFK